MVSIMLDLKGRGLFEASEMAIGGGSLGFWEALKKPYDKTRWKRYWIHKTVNILNKLPKSIQANTREKIHQNKARDCFFTKTVQTMAFKISKCA